MAKPSKKRFNELCQLAENKDNTFIGRSSGGTEYIFLIDEPTLNVYYRTFSDNTATGEVNAVKFSKFKLDNPSLSQVEIGDKDSLDREDHVYNDQIIAKIKEFKTKRKINQAANKKGDEKMNENEIKQGVVAQEGQPVEQPTQPVVEEQVVETEPAVVNEPAEAPVVEQQPAQPEVKTEPKPVNSSNDVDFTLKYGNYLKYLLDEAEYSDDFRKIPLDERRNAAFKLFSYELQRVFPEVENLLTVENVRKNYNNGLQYNFIDENKQPVELTEEQQNVVDLVNSHFENFHYEEEVEDLVSKLAGRFVNLKLDTGRDQKGWEEEILNLVENGQLFVIDSQVPYSATQKQAFLNANRDLIDLQIKNAVRGVEAQDNLKTVFEVYAENLAKLGGKKTVKTWLAEITRVYGKTGKETAVSTENISEEQKVLVNDLNRFISDIHYEENRDYEISALAETLTGKWNLDFKKADWEAEIRKAIDSGKRYEATEEGTQNYVLDLNKKLISWTIQDALRYASNKEKHDVIVRTLALEMKHVFGGKDVEEWRVEIENAYKENKNFEVKYDGEMPPVKNQVVDIVNKHLRDLHAQEEKENALVVPQQGGVKKRTKKPLSPATKKTLTAIFASIVAFGLVTGAVALGIHITKNSEDNNKGDGNTNSDTNVNTNGDVSINNATIAEKLEDKFGEKLDLQSVVTEVKDGKVTVIVKSEDGQKLYKVVGADKGNDGKVTLDDVNDLLLTENATEACLGTKFFTGAHEGEMENANEVYVFVSKPDAEYNVNVCTYEYTVNGVITTQGSCKISATKFNNDADYEQKAVLVALGKSDYNGYRQGESEKNMTTDNNGTVKPVEDENENTTTAAVAENGDKYLFVPGGEREL